MSPRAPSSFGRWSSLSLFVALVACGGDEAPSGGAANTAGTSSAAGGSSARAGASGAAGQGQSGAGAGAGTGQGGSAAGSAGATASTCEVGACAAYAEATTAIAPSDALPLLELSGLAASHVHPGVFYGHNDSGDTPRFFAIAEDGASAGEWSLVGASAVDWEDMARGPCGATGEAAARSCLFFADIGDNLLKRSEHVVYRVEEPKTLGGSQTLDAVSKLVFGYPEDEKHDAETLIVDPATGVPYVVTKLVTGASKVFRLPNAWDEGPVVAGFVTGLQAPAGANMQFTGGDAHPCGDRLLLRTYKRVYEARLVPGGPSGFEALFSTELTIITQVAAPQAEAVAYRADGLGYLLGSEGPTVQPLVSVGCAP